MPGDKICFRARRQTRGEGRDCADVLGIEMQRQFAAGASTPMTARGRIGAVEPADIEAVDRESAPVLAKSNAICPVSIVPAPESASFTDRASKRSARSRSPV